LFQISLALVINKFFNNSFFVESGCKDTTNFQTDKIFFQKKIISCHQILICSHLKLKLFFQSRRKQATKYAEDSSNKQKSKRNKMTLK